MSTEPLVPERVTREWIQQASVERLFLYVQRLNRQLQKDLKQKQHEVDRLQQELAASKAASASTQPPPVEHIPAREAPISKGDPPIAFKPRRQPQEGSGVAPTSTQGLPPPIQQTRRPAKKAAGHRRARPARRTRNESSNASEAAASGPASGSQRGPPKTEFS